VAAAPAQQPAAVPVHQALRGVPPEDELPDIPVPEGIGKDQVRRVAFLYLGKFKAERDAMATLLEQTAQTMLKKPLFIRRVLYQAITEDSEIKEVLARVIQSKAVAALGIVEGLSETKLRELGAALPGESVLFRSVTPLDAGKKSVSIDIVVDMMMLPSERP
jgi:hypothetical protein